MMNICSVSSSHMPSYNLVLSLKFWVWWLDVQTLSLKLVGSEKAEFESRLLWVMIWLKRVAMIFSYMMLEFRSISFQKYKNKNKSSLVICNSHPEPYELQVWKAFPHMHLLFSLSLVKLLWPFERIISYAHDQDHILVHSHAILLYLEDSKYIHPSTNKTPCCTMFISLQSYHHDVWAIQK